MDDVILIAAWEGEESTLRGDMSVYLVPRPPPHVFRSLDIGHCREREREGGGEGGREGGGRERGREEGREGGREREGEGEGEGEGMRERKEDSLTGQIRTERKRWRPATNLRLPNQPHPMILRMRICAKTRIF